MGLGSSRCFVVWLATTGAALAVEAAVWPTAVSAAGAATSFDVALVRVSAVATAGVTAWLWVAATLVSVDAARGRRRSRRCVPDGVRRAVLALCGAAVVTGLTSPVALAAGGVAPGPAVLEGLRLPERVAVPPAARAAPVAADPVPEVVVVRPGDSLWSIAERRLGPGATTSEVAAAWPRLYAANRDVVGPDPAHLEPGQRLVVPEGGLER